MANVPGQIRVGTKAIAAAVLNNMVVHGDIIIDEGGLFTISPKGILKHMDSGAFSGPSYHAGRLVQALKAGELDNGKITDPIYNELFKLLKKQIEKAAKVHQ